MNIVRVTTFDCFDETSRIKKYFIDNQIQGKAGSYRLCISDDEISLNAISPKNRKNIDYPRIEVLENGHLKIAKEFVLIKIEQMAKAMNRGVNDYIDYLKDTVKVYVRLDENGRYQKDDDGVITIYDEPTSIGNVDSENIQFVRGTFVKIDNAHNRAQNSFVPISSLKSEQAVRPKELKLMEKNLIQANRTSELQTELSTSESEIETNRRVRFRDTSVKSGIMTDEESTSENVTNTYGLNTETDSSCSEPEADSEQKDGVYRTFNQCASFIDSIPACQSRRYYISTFMDEGQKKFKIRKVKIDKFNNLLKNSRIIKMDVAGNSYYKEVI